MSSIIGKHSPWLARLVFDIRSVASRVRKILTRNDRCAQFALFLFLIFYLTITYLNLRAHTAPPRWDDSWYLTNSEIFYKALIGNDKYSAMYYDVNISSEFYLFTLFSRLLNGYRAPLIALIPLPAYLTLGTGAPGLTATYFLLILFFTGVLYQFTSKVYDQWTAFLAVAITSTMPLTIGLSRTFYIEYGLMILTVIWVSLQIQSDHFRNKHYIIPLGIIFGLGMLMKVAFPLYIIGPVLGGLISTFKENVSNKTLPKIIGHCLVILLIGIVVMSSWYIASLDRVISNALNSGFGNDSQNYSLGNIFEITTLFRYWVSAINGGISFYYFLLLTILITIVGLKQVKKTKYQAPQTVNKPMSKNLTIILIWFFIPFIIFSFGVNKDYRFLLPVLPALGIIIAKLIMDAVSRRDLKLVMIPLIMIVPCFMFVYTSLPLSFTIEASLPPFLILTPNNGYAMRPVQQIWNQEKILMRIEQDAQENKVNIDFPIGIIPNAQYFNALNFMYVSVNQDFSYQYESFLPTKNPAAWTAQKERLLKMDYVVTKTGDLGPAFAYNPDIPSLLLGEYLSFTEVTRFPLPDGSEAIIYRKK